METLKDIFLSVNAKRNDGVYKPHKPLLLLSALLRCGRGEQRLARFEEYEDELRWASQFVGNFSLVYPFGRLRGDGLWDIPEWDSLTKNSSGDLSRAELIEGGIMGGFEPRIFASLNSTPEMVRPIARAVVRKFFAEGIRDAILDFLELVEREPSVNHNDFENPSVSPPLEIESLVSYAVRDEAFDSRWRGNDFIGYLNSLHNLTANGANALAESQALSQFFGELYEPFSVVDPLKALLTDGTPRVVILTGHAGDGKSTVALDIFKELKGLPSGAPLSAPLGEREDVPSRTGQVTLVKDMSELSAPRRQQWLREAFNTDGSWLIVSNTGPLLDSLEEYSAGAGLPDIESRLLDLLDRPVNEAALEGHELEGFGKPLLILNLTRLDNVALGSRVLMKLIRHSGWQQCTGCAIEPACPLVLNRRALMDVAAVVEERVRWLYRRINDYEQRLTLRQIVAQLAFALTGGMGCVDARNTVVAATGSGAERGTGGLREIVFSEGFFGQRDGRPVRAAESLKAIRLLRRSPIGGPVAPDMERAAVDAQDRGWAVLPETVQHLAKHWRALGCEPEGLPARAALRRLALIFGQAKPGRSEEAEVFLDAMLHSPSVRQLDAWQRAGRLTLSRTEQKRLRTGCLNVLLEAFSGFSAGQFDDQRDQLYLTLRRPDRAVVQPTQLIIGSMPFRDFDLEYDSGARVLRLAYRHAPVALDLPLPLLDFIRRRDDGELGNGLSPIHQAQLDRFHARLLQLADEQENRSGEVLFLRAGISGNIDVLRYFLDESKQKLERD